jgi:fatty-acyl-CoA synthase
VTPTFTTPDDFEAITGSGAVTSVLDTMAERLPDALAISVPGQTATFRELADATVAMARRIQAAGIEPGDRVGVFLLQASVDCIAALLGALRVGAIAVPVNARYKARELRYVVEHAGLRLLITEPHFDELIAGADLPEDCRVVVLGRDDAFVSAGEQVSPEQVAERSRAVRGGDEAIIIYTSGTTAAPKGAVHSHRAVVAQGIRFGDRLGLTEGERFWTPLPMFHVGGWNVLLSAHAKGASFHHVGIFEPEKALDQLERERISFAFPAFETIWMPILTHPRFKEADLSSLKRVINVGVPERMKLMQDMVPQAIQVSCTGMTESLGFLCLGHWEDSEHSRTHTSGRPLPGMEVRVVDPETGRDQPPGVPGELIFRGDMRFLRYHNDPEATRQSIDADGWFHSGDLVTRNEDGTVSFVSRLKDMLKVGGENVAAAEIEGHLLGHPAVHLVQVVAAPDARYGEVPAAFVILKPGATATEQELIDFCRGEIATFKVPRYVRFVDEYPMSGTKVQKYKLRERIAAELKAAGITEAPKISSKKEEPAKA